jgi:hypothetical protein
MTAAVCIKCRARRHGALTLCPSCGFDSTESIDKAKSMILTDHILSHDDLERIGERIRTGLPVGYPEEAVDQYVKAFSQGADRPPKAMWVGCVALVVVLLFVVYLFFRGF